MTSHSEPDHQPRSLAESWATLSASDAHSEDGARSEQTDVGSLIDPAGPDDVASLDDRYTSSEVEGHEDYDDDEDRSSGSECQDLPTLFPHAGDTINDSGLTTRPAFHQSTDSIEFSEPEKWPEAERVELKHTIQVFEGDDAAEMKEKLPYNLADSVLVATVQQTMTRQSLGIDKPFHVLYIGNPEFRNIILDKFGDVLVSGAGSGFESSSTESSRFHVVPTSFGAGAIPNFAELLPIHVQLIVDECIRATSSYQANKPCTVSLDFKNRPSCTSSWTGSDYHVSSSVEWTSPDMAVLFVSSRDDAAAVRTQKLARIFMERLGVPTMVISEEPLWKMTTELIAVNHHSLHMCLASRHPVTGESVVLRRYPIDLNTFESITPNQLNRNIASLATIYPKKAYKATSQKTRFPDRKGFFDPEKYPLNMLPFSSSRAHEFARTWRLLTLSIITAIAVSLGLSALKIAGVSILQCFTGPGASDLSSPAFSGQAASSFLPYKGLKQASVSMTPPDNVHSLIHQLDGYSNVEQLTELGSGHEQGGDSFEIRAIGDCHVIIKPPQEFVSRRKRPRFEVELRRQDEALPHELSKLFEGVYTLKLDREDAYGPVNVTITTMRPRFTQTTELDFGTPWLKMANWKRTAQAVSTQVTRDLTIAHVSASEVYGRLQCDLQALMEDVVGKSHSLRRETDWLLRDSVQISLAARDTLLSRSKQLSEVIRRDGLPRIQAASSAFQGHTGRAKQEAKELVSNAWNRIMVWAQAVDINAMTDSIRNIQQSNALDMAQKRARSLLGREACERSSSVQGDQG
ncbi:hypothetical protein PHISP_00409 [Aspergillus sp. HF37]|nr:hypothetical protein PHISP_00409 [Aspergillus sp. HF37]